MITPELKRGFDRLPVTEGRVRGQYTYTDIPNAELLEGRAPRIAVDEDPAPGNDARVVLAVVSQVIAECLECRIDLVRVGG